MSKYYTPEIEEFHVGFEYEQYNKDVKYFIDPNIKEIDFLGYEIENPCKKIILGWSKQILKENDSLPPQQYLYLNNILEYKPFETRVKYLDKEDIESLGFKHIGGKLDNKTLQEFKGKVKKGYYLHLTCTWFSFGCVVTIKTSVNENSEKTLVVHSINIKNKSELKKLLKQLNIK